ncbi:MAG: bifunctional folylpolyglutamate synthase/dihydrofolate synthase, partial [Lachnospiraceae bacterium]|nr:bifunctional folylpolyglutamate synthase/dihydrofolate synthase [Lachnospiraceae bacterium]
PVFLVDGAHNEDGANALAKSLKEYFPNKKFHMIVGILADKAYDKMLETMLPFAKEVYCVTPQNPRALEAKELEKIICRMPFHIETHCCDNLEEALRQAYFDTKEDALAFGSLYYVGRIRKLFLDIDR